MKMNSINILSGKCQIGKSDIPLPKPHEVLIKVFAAGVNRADILQKQGKYPPPQGASNILGLEVAGEIVRLGSDVTNWKIGDKVCALLEGGGYAEYAAAPSQQILPIPNGFDYIKAASLPEALFTVWSNLFHHSKIKPGETLLVHGGTSGIGIAAVQIAKEFGIICYATAGSDKKCNFLRDLGVKQAINYKTEDFYSIISSLGGVDVILDMVGGEYFNKNINILNQGGRLVSIAFIGGAQAQVNFAPVLMKNLTLMGTTLRRKSLQDKAKIALELQEKLWPLLENGSIKPIIDSVFSLEEAEKAHELMKSSTHIGKIVLKIV
ncbi:MAG: putative quinone oxidoreductase, family [Rickettsiaceae bacterium]|jgi:NADPH2:quinone reductase|nr:putative quinone oxidoreductase, family [Rickettsiaceae bacterium]